MSGRAVFDLPDADYRATPGVSYSLLKRYHVSGAHGRAQELGLLQNPETDALFFGRAFDLALLSRAEFDQKVVFAPDWNRNSTDWKKWAADQAGKIILKPDQYAAIVGMEAALRRHPKASSIMAEGYSQVSLFDTATVNWAEGLSLRQSQVPVKGRVDFIPTSGEWTDAMVDVKTVVDGSPQGFRKALRKLLYYMQGPFYLDLGAGAGFQRTRFIFVCCEKVPPYNVSVYQVSAKTLELGRRLYGDLLAFYTKCHELHHWPTYSEEVEEIGIEIERN